VATFIALNSIDDPRVAEYRLLSDAELLRDRNLFVAEGRLVVQRVLSDPSCRVQSLLLSSASRRALEADLFRLPAETPVYSCDVNWFRGLTGFNLHRGCLALVERPAPSAPDELLAHARTVVVLENLANADNIGGVFRNAAALNADAVLLSPLCCDPLYRKAMRTSMGAVLRVPFARLERWPDDLRLLRESGFAIAALTLQDASDDIGALAGHAVNRLAIVAGGEGSGLTADALAQADLRVRIPMTDRVDSLNVSVAVAIALHTVGAARAQPG
jgi:tRNA G18 (ribose-2'-O)-methylase SpoU